MDDGANRTDQGSPDGDERFRTIYERAGVGIEQVAPDGRLTEVNEALCRLLGYSRDELLRLTFEDITHPDDLATDAENMRRLFAGEVGSYAREKRYLRKDGSPVWILLTASVVLGPSGEPASCISVVQDITDRKRAEEALLAAERRKDRFLAVLAHELRSPLSAIGGAARLIDPAGSAEHQRWAKEVIERQVGNLARLVDGLLDVSRIAEGKIRIEKGRIDAITIVGRAAETAGGLIEERSHRLDVSVGPGPLWLDADPIRLEQVLVNLLNNAAKYTPAGGRIWLTAGREGEEVVISVRDNGLGISSELLPRLYDPFMQAERSLDYSGGGLGIGLPLVRTLVELHGGTIEARSEGHGKGSEFRVRLPACDRPPSRSAGDDASSAVP